MTSTTHTGAIDAGAVEKALEAVWNAKRRMLGHGPGRLPESRTDFRGYWAPIIIEIAAALATPSPTAASETSDLAEENKRLREALEPFAEASAGLEHVGHAHDDELFFDMDGYPSLTLGDFRRARAALRASKGTESHG